MSTWTPPPGMTVEHLHGVEEQPVHVAVVTLAPGASMLESETHDLTERIRLLSGGVCVLLGSGEAPIDLAEMPGARKTIEIPAGQPHRLINWMRAKPAVYVVTMTRPRVDERAARDRALDDVGDAIQKEAEGFDEGTASAIVTAANVAIDSLRAS